MTGLRSNLVVTGLLRAAEAVGGNGAVVAKGDPDSGAVMLILTCRGVDPILLERVSGIEGGLHWNQRNYAESIDFQRVARLVAQKKRFDLDLWVIELDVPNVEQFIADSLA